MAHFNLYEKLGLSQNQQAFDLNEILGDRLRGLGDDHSPEAQELAMARNVIGDPQKKSMYDQQLNDPNCPDITVEDVRELAQLNLGGAGFGAAPSANDADDQTRALHGATQHNAAQQPNQNPYGAAPYAGNPWGMQAGQAQAGQGQAQPNQAQPNQGQPGAKEQMTQFANSTKNFANMGLNEAKGTFRGVPKKPLVITAVASVLATVLLGGAIMASTHFMSAETKAERATKGLFKLDTVDDAEKWILKNVPASARNDMRDSLKLDSGYSGMEAYFGAEELDVGDTVDFTAITRMMQQDNDISVEEALSDLGIDADATEDSKLYVVEVLSDEKPVGMSLALVSDGDAKIIGVENF
ncbi:hypothetical protein [Corynebacterium sp. H78]|uniref:hypothetical protein n=1 Tax=Corynebacterium sp. H78 TaxID=3133417 RepID=UPI0030AF427D